MFPVLDKDGKLLAAFANEADARDWRQFKIVSEYKPLESIAPERGMVFENPGCFSAPLSSAGRQEVMERQDALTPEEVQAVKEAYQPVHDAILDQNGVFVGDVEREDLGRFGMYISVAPEELHGPTLREMEQEAAETPPIPAPAQAWIPPAWIPRALLPGASRQEKEEYIKARRKDWEEANRQPEAAAPPKIGVPASPSEGDALMEFFKG